MNEITNASLKCVKTLEIVRCFCVGLGLYFAYAIPYDPDLIMHYLLIGIVIPLAGLTGLESLLFGSASALAKGREVGSAYQIQSGMNNLALALSGIIVWIFHWGIYASLALLTALLLFLTLSSINHSFEYLYSENKKTIHLLRPLFTLSLLIASIPLLCRIFIKIN